MRARLELLFKTRELGSVVVAFFSPGKRVVRFEGEVDVERERLATGRDKIGGRVEVDLSPVGTVRRD